MILIRKEGLPIVFLSSMGESYQILWGWSKPEKFVASRVAIRLAKTDKNR